MITTKDSPSRDPAQELRDVARASRKLKRAIERAQADERAPVLRYAPATARMPRTPSGSRKAS